MRGHTRHWFVLRAWENENERKENTEGLLTPSCSWYLPNSQPKFPCLPWKMSSLLGQPAGALQAFLTPRELSTLTCALELCASSALIAEWWNLVWRNLLLQDDGRRQTVLARTVVAPFEQGTSKGSLHSIWPSGMRPQHLGYTRHFGCCLLPWDAPTSLEALEAGMGSIIPSWEGYNHPWERTELKDESAGKVSQRHCPLCQALKIWLPGGKQGGGHSK